MLNSTFSKVIFGGFLLLFIIFPFTSYQHPQNSNVSADDTDDTIACSVPAPPAANRVRLNKNAVKFVSSYIKKNNGELVKIKERSTTPFKTMDAVFTKYGLPLELKYLAVIESELNPAAVSRVGAVGTWQLMPVTAKILGLKVSRKNDERKQVAKSTNAAALYLRDLYSEFGDWLLVMAAYNCGPGPVYSAIRKSGSHNFWKLQDYLPEESRDHVKKFIATHYYFEGNGSATTLTKAENIRYNNMLKVTSAKAIAPVTLKSDEIYKREQNDLKETVVFGY